MISKKQIRSALLSAFVATGALSGLDAQAAETIDVPVFITLGQSNADGSAMFDSSLDEAMRSWYTSSANPGTMKMWYRSTQVQNQTSNALGEAARWTIDGTTTDVQPGWLDLWYRNENTDGRTAMNMIHGYGTYSTGTGTDCAQGRRGMEGAFGKTFATLMPESELYMLKLGVSGSFISSWANPLDDTNWNYFYENIFKPAMLDLLAKGKRPHLAGIWWMQGCADRDRSQEYYQEALMRLVGRINNELGFADGTIYVGHIIKPGESDVTPTGSVQYGQGVRDAQDAVAAAIESVEVVDTRNFPLQYESSFSGYLHFNHQGVNDIGTELANRVVTAGMDKWATFSTPGRWEKTDESAIFVPAFGNPDIEYSTIDDVVTAIIHYPGFDDVKTYTVSGDEQSGTLSPGYLDCNGTGYMRIPNHDDFTIAAGQSMTISMRYYLNAWASSGNYYGLVCNNFRNSSLVRSGFDLFVGSSSSQTLGNNVVPNVGASSGATNFGGTFITSGYTPGNWATAVWTYDGQTGESKIYINGVVLRETTCNQRSYPITSFADILVGARWILNNDPTTGINGILNGKIDDLRFYNRALSASEVAAESTITVDENTTDLIAAYDFTSIHGLVVPDISGNGHDANLVNFAPYTEGEPIEIDTPVGGSIAVYNDGSAITSGTPIEAGTVLTVVATPASNYVLDYITVNGQPIEGNSFVVNGPATVSAVFSRDPYAPSIVPVYTMNEDGSKFYRIPAICTTHAGTLLAIADKRGDSGDDLPNTISVVVKRSTDGGETWSDMSVIAQGGNGKTYGDAAVVVDRETGTILVTFVGDTGFFTYPSGSVKPTMYYIKSTDDGLTWTEPRSIDDVYQSDWRAAFIASGSGHQTADGRIMFVANARCSNSASVTDVYEFLIYTDDLGETWHVANPTGRYPQGGYGNESKVVELTDGSLLMSMRYGGHRRFMSSTDGGATWSTPRSVEELVEPSSGYGCNGDFIRYPSTDGQTRLLHTSAANSGSRSDITVFLSYDEGQTWPISKRLTDESSAYSALTVLPDGSIGCFLEEINPEAEAQNVVSYNLIFQRFTLEWLTDGKDTGNIGEDESFNLTIETPDASKGTLRVYDGETQVFSGRRIKSGTELSVVAEGISPYILDAILVNGESLEDGTTTFTVESDVTISAQFIRDINLTATYVEPSGDSGSGANSYVETASTTGAATDINITRTAKRSSNWELADDQTIVVNPNQTFSLRLQAKKTNTSSTTVPSPQDLRYCVAYIFSDWDADGIFTLENPTDGVFDSYGHYGYFEQEGAWAGNIAANYAHVMDINHTFKVPADAFLGLSRIRVIYTEAWDNVAKGGGINGNYQTINKGYSYDYLVNCVESSAAIDSIDADSLNAAIEYFNLQGIRVAAENLTPGIYIVRQGSKTSKVYVK